MVQHNWSVGERVSYDDGIDGGTGVVIDIAKLLNEQHLLIEWDDGSATEWWHATNKALSPLPTKPALDPVYGGYDLNALAPEIPLADKIRLAGQTSAFVHSTPRFMLNAILRAMWGMEQDEQKAKA